MQMCSVMLHCILNMRMTAALLAASALRWEAMAVALRGGGGFRGMKGYTAEIRFKVMQNTRGDDHLTPSCGPRREKVPQSCASCFIRMITIKQF